jgi:hypothetical protein
VWLFGGVRMTGLDWWHSKVALEVRPAIRAYRRKTRAAFDSADETEAHFRTRRTTSAPLSPSSSTRCSAPMLQRRAQGATRKYVARKKACCKLKLLYTTAAQAVEQRPQNGLNAFISTDLSHLELETPESLAPGDAIAIGVYLALRRGLTMENC